MHLNDRASDGDGRLHVTRTSGRHPFGYWRIRYLFTWLHPVLIADSQKPVCQGQRLLKRFWPIARFLPARSVRRTARFSRRSNCRRPQSRLEKDDCQTSGGSVSNHGGNAGGSATIAKSAGWRSGRSGSSRFPNDEVLHRMHPQSLHIRQVSCNRRCHRRQHLGLDLQIQMTNIPVPRIPPLATCHEAVHRPRAFLTLLAHGPKSLFEPNPVQQATAHLKCRRPRPPTQVKFPATDR